VGGSNAVEMEYEKTYLRWLLYNKKRYAGWLYKLVDGAMVRGKKPDSSGMETRRRDVIPLVRHLVQRTLDTFMDESLSGADARNRVRQIIATEIAQIQANRVSWNHLIESRQFRKRAAEYGANNSAIPIHINLAARLEARYGKTATATPRPGDRVFYVVTKTANPLAKRSETAEEPDYAWRHRLPLDTEYYIDRVRDTMQRVLEPIIAPNAHRERSDAARKRKLAFEMDEFMAAATVVAAPTSRKRAHLAIGFEEEHRCPLCNALVDAEHAICAVHSDADRAQFHAQRTTVTANLRDERAKLLEQCTTCRESTVPPDIESLTLEAANPCDSKQCQFYQERRMNDRLYFETQ